MCSMVFVNSIVFSFMYVVFFWLQIIYPNLSKLEVNFFCPIPPNIDQKVLEESKVKLSLIWFSAPL